MKFKIFLLYMLFTSTFASAQTGYTPVNGSYSWTRGLFRDGLSIPTMFSTYGPDSAKIAYVGRGLWYQTDTGWTRLVALSWLDAFVRYTDTSAALGPYLRKADVPLYAVSNQFNQAQSADFWITGRGRFGNAVQIGGSATIPAALHVISRPSDFNLAAVFEGNIQMAPAIAGSHAVTRSQVTDSLAVFTLQRAAHNKDTVTVPVVFNKIVSNGFIPGSIVDGAIEINRSINDGLTTNARGWRDNTVFRRGSASPVSGASQSDYSYASGDMVAVLRGANFHHIVGYQSRQYIDVTGKANLMYSFLGQSNITNGLADTVVGIMLRAPALNVSSVTASVNRWYGAYIEPYTGGALSNYNIYAPGTPPSYFGGNIDIGSGTLNLAGASTNRVVMTPVGAGAPTFTTRSSGTKLVLWDAVGPVSGDEALGIESSHMWFSVRDNTNARGFKFYGGTSQVARISGTGMAIFGSTSSATSTLQTAGSFAAPHTVTSGNLTLTDAHYTARVSNSAHAITLPSASTCPGRIYEIINYNTGGAVTISPVQIFGSATTSIPNNTSWRIQSDGTNWILLSRSN